MATLLVVLVKEVDVPVIWDFELHLVVVVVPSSGTGIVTSSLETNALPPVMKFTLWGAFQIGLVGTLLLKDVE